VAKADARAPSGRARRRGGRRLLSREQIVERALALADREGLEALTMRRLADDLGVGTMTLYSYFRDKDELIDAAVSRVASKVVIPSAQGPWRARLRTLIKEIHRSLVEHPSGVELRRRRPMLTPAALQTTEAGMRILTGAGFSAADAAKAWRTLFVYTFGYASFTPAEVPAQTRRDWRSRLTALPVEEFPVLRAAVAEAVETMSGEAAFDHGLDCLLDGLEASLSAKPPRRRR
jgi:AcrR family transcriptional regulator